MDRRIGRYEVLAELGRGGFGHVYRCLDPNLGTPVAIKILTADGDAGMMVRFRNEAATSRRLRHPNIVTIYDFGDQDGVPYIVMELLEGEDLHRVIETHRPLSLLHKIGIMSQVAAGLGHAHKEGIIHRDVKPANVMLLRDGSVKMMDFGIALITQSTHSRLTPRGAVIGTFRYMAPEQFRGAEPDARSDIFSYGLIFYELLSGMHPFHATEAAAQMYNILSIEPVPIGERCPECPPELRSVLARLLNKDPEVRYQSLDDVLFDIEPALLKLRENRSVELVTEARLAQRQEQLEKAQGLIREALTLTPASETARELREQLQAEVRRHAVKPKVADLVKRAHEAMAAGNPSDAAQSFESAIRLDPLDTALLKLLDDARLAAERLREATKLLADAEGALVHGDAAGAAQLASRALDLVPSLPRAQEVFRQAEATLAEEKRRSRFAEDSAHVRMLIELHSWEEASEVLSGLDRDFPDHPEVRSLAERLNAGQKKEEDERKLAAGLAAARARFRDGYLSGALAGLEALSAQFPQSAEAGSMLSAVRQEMEAKRRRELVAESVEKAQFLVAQQQFEAAVKVLDGALGQYPADADLQRERRVVVSASFEAARRTAIQKAIAQAGELRSQARFADAVKVLDACLSSNGGDRAIAELRTTILDEEEAARREAEFSEYFQRAKEMIAKGELEGATRLLEASPAHVRENSEITRLQNAADLQKRLRAEKQAALEALTVEVQPLCSQGRFDEALQRVDQFENRHGTDSEAAEMRNRIRSDQQRAQRSAEELHAQVTALIASDPLRATVLLSGAPDRLRGRPEIRNLEQAAQRAAAEKRVREAAGELIPRAKSLCGEGRFAEALGLVDSGLKSYPGQPDLMTFRAEALAAQERQQQQLRAEQARAEQARAEQARAEQARAEQLRAEQARAEKLRAEQARAEQARAEQLRAEQARAEKLRAEQLRAEQERAKPKSLGETAAPTQPSRDSGDQMGVRWLMAAAAVLFLIGAVLVIVHFTRTSGHESASGESVKQDEPSKQDETKTSVAGQTHPEVASSGGANQANAGTASSTNTRSTNTKSSNTNSSDTSKPGRKDTQASTQSHDTGNVVATGNVASTTSGPADTTGSPKPPAGEGPGLTAAVTTSSNGDNAGRDASLPKPKACVPESGDVSKYNGDHHGTLRWVSAGQSGATQVTIWARQADVGRIADGIPFPNWPVTVTLPRGGKIVQQPDNCNGRRLVIEKPAALDEVVIEWNVR